MYIGTLIENIIRPKTGNTAYSVNSTTGVTEEGISQDLIVSFINDALAFIQSRIIAVYPGEFVEEDVQNTVTDQEEYEVDDNIFLKNKFISVEYSKSGNLDDYELLPPAGLHQRDTSSGTPYQYIRRNGKILLNKIPKDTTGKLRVNYYRWLDKLDVRRGLVSSKTTGTIVLASGATLDSNAMGDAQYICVVDSVGVVQDYNIPVTSWDSTSRTIVMPTGTYNVAINDYVVVGKYTSTHLPAGKPERILDYCKVFAQARIHNMDSSTDEINEMREVRDVLNDIVDQFSEMTEDIQDIPIIDSLLRS